MTTGTIAVLAFAAALALLVFTAGHKLGRRSCRSEYPDGWDQGQAAERARWEEATGATYERLFAEITSEVPDVPGPDGWPFRSGEFAEPPATDVLLAEAVRQGFTGPHEDPHYPSCDAPVVANITDARPSGFVKLEGVELRPELADAIRRALAEGDTAAMTGVIVEHLKHAGGRVPDARADWDVLAGAGLPDYAAAALGGHRTVDECVDSIVMRAVTT